MELNLKGRVALVTGGGSGIGRCIAQTFVREGVRVVINDVRQAAIDETLALIKEQGGEAASGCFDITDLDATRKAVREIEAGFGKIDILVNNAAVLQEHGLFLESDPAKCDLEIKVALYGTMNCCRAIVPGMVERNYGKVVNIVTDAARVGQARQCNYSAAKGGVISFTKSFAKEVGPNNINVNAVSPGATNSPIRQEMVRQLVAKLGQERADEREEKVKRMYALRRIGEPEDVANAVVYLASEPARHITGQILSVNGGFAMPG